MAKRHLRKGSITIEQTNPHGYFYQTDYVTVNIRFWQHIMPRGALKIIEGFHTSEEIDEIVSKAERMREKSSSTCSDCPKYVSFTCRAEDLLKLARTIIETYETETNES